MSLKRALFLVLFLDLAFRGLSQISAPGSYLKIPAEYSIASITPAGDTLLVTDTIFVFKTPVGNNFPVNAMLSASFHNTDNLIYEWSQFDPVAMLYNRFIRTDTAVSSTIENLSAGGYQVKITGNGIDTVFRAWVFINYFKVKLKQDSRCDGVEFTWGYQAGISGKSFNYYNFTDSTTHIIQNGLNIVWSAKKKNSNDEFEDVEYDYGNKYFANMVLYDDHKFYLRVNDSFGLNGKDSINFFAISVKPTFKAVRAPGHPAYETDTTGGAPFYVSFIDSSFNVELWTWKFHNDEDRIINGRDSFLRIDNSQVIYDSVEYKKPGEYNVELYVQGPIYYLEGEARRCDSSLVKQKYIIVDTSWVGIEMPNVFVPDGSDEKNKRFRPTPNEKESVSSSLEYFEIYIYSRWGNRVYKFETSDKFVYDTWEGWNGKVGGNGPDAQPGIYFYVIKAQGLDGRDQSKKGFVYLFRNQ